MAAYDSPDFAAPLPGGGRARFGQPGGSIPQSIAEQPQTMVTLHAPDGSTRVAGVDHCDVLVESQEAVYNGTESISGVSGIGSTGAGQGHVTGPTHPNATYQGGRP